MASRRSIYKDNNFYQRVILSSLTRFLEDLDSNSIIDLFLERNFIPYTEVRDIQDLRLSSERIRAILRKVASRGRKGYREFKKFLIESQQEHLAEYLDDKEAELVKEIRMAEKKQESVIPARTLPTVLKGRHRKPDDKELLDISDHIGFNWEMLGPYLGVPTTKVDQIKMDNITSHMQKYKLLHFWRETKSSNATIENLLSKMKLVPQSVNISWKAVEETVSRYDVQARRYDVQASSMPDEILRMDENSIQLYKRALSDGYEADHAIRVMVVGHYGVGKTTLTKRLLREEVDIDKRVITNGIDVHVSRCKVAINTGKWNTSNKDQNSASRRVREILKRTILDKNKREMEEEETEEDIDTGFMTGEQVNMESESTIERAESNDVSPAMTPNEEVHRNELKKLIEEEEQHSTDDDVSNTADLSLWDFAGQYAFYDTHQVFLSRRAVYLLVNDISKRCEDIVEDDDCFVDSKGRKQWTISEFAHFWLNSIHEFCSTDGDKGPPVLLVGTFADKLNQESKEKTIDEFFLTLRRSLLHKPTSCHLIEEDFAIDNSVIDTNIERLRKQILNTASKQSYWGKRIPARWITLENKMIGLKNDGVKVLQKEDLYTLNKEMPVAIETEEELELFLQFHHDSGNILYYSDDKLNESIVLDPQFLIDAFKSLIGAKKKCSKEQNIFMKWIQFEESAILTVDLVGAIWTKEMNSDFHEHRRLLLDYLEILGFIAKPIQSSENTKMEDSYFAPCVLKRPPPKDLLSCQDFMNRKFTSKICFTTASGFLPTAVFNKLLAACINKWQLFEKNKKSLLFCGCGLFNLKDNHTLFVFFFDHVIQVWVRRISIEHLEPDFSLCSEVLDFIFDLLQNRFKLSGLKVLVRCQISELDSNDDNMFSIKEKAEQTEVMCNCTLEVHKFMDLTKYWSGSKGNSSMSPIKLPGVKREKQKMEPTPAPHDGRLLSIDVQTVLQLIENSNIRLRSDDIRDVFFHTENTEWEIPLVVKKVSCKDHPDRMMSITNEKLASRTRHFAIVPLLALAEDLQEHMFYFLSPYLEQGDLYEAIKRDTSGLEAGKVLLKRANRVRIIFQINSALQFLHTSIPGVRGIIVHMDIRTKNIVLDCNLNARIIGFGHAREINETDTSTHVTPKDDYYKFGIVIRELLTGKPAHDENKPDEELLKQDKGNKNSDIQIIWSTKSTEAKELNDIADQCIKKEKDSRNTGFKVEDICESFMSRNNVEKWAKGKANEEDNVKCEMCIVNPAVRMQNVVYGHSEGCGCHMLICISCIRNSFYNPMKCHSCGENLQSIIGNGWGAVLIAGNDKRKNVKLAQTFSKEISDIHDVITSKCPLVMGISKENTRVVQPANPGESGEMLPMIDQAFDDLQGKGDINTLLIYFSGHHYQDKGFQLGNETEFLTVEKLQEKMENFSKSYTSKELRSDYNSSRRFMVFFDCCASPGVTLPNLKDTKDYSILQINSCRSFQTADADENIGSFFTKFFIQALTRRAFHQKCINNGCDESNCLLGEFVTAQELFEYISDHIRVYSEGSHQTTLQQPVKFEHNALLHDLLIAYNIDFLVDIEFKVKGHEEKYSVQHQIFPDLKSLRLHLFKKLIEKLKPDHKLDVRHYPDFEESLCIEIDQDQNETEELDSLEKVMGAWNSKRELSVSFRILVKICRGMVWIDTPVEKIQNTLMDPTLELKPEQESKDAFTKMSLSYTLVDKIIEDMEETDDEEVKTLRSCLIDMRQGINNAKTVCKGKDTKVHFIFPKQSLDFMCFQVTGLEKKETL